MDHLILATRPDLVIMKKKKHEEMNKEKKRTCCPMDFEIPTDHRAKIE